MRKHYLNTILLTTLLFTGCGGDGGSSDNNKNPESNINIDIKKYSIKAIPTSEGNCRGAEGTMIIQKSKISGTVKTGWGDNLVISGTYGDSLGDVEGGFAKNNKRLVTYEGYIILGEGKGKWSDSIGCSGTWTAKEKKSNSNPSQTDNSQESNPQATESGDFHGYKISYNGDGLLYSITFGCDDTFTSTASRHGITVENEEGDTTVIDGDTLVVKATFDIKITLINGAIVKGKSTVDGNPISKVERISQCN